MSQKSEETLIFILFISLVADSFGQRKGLLLHSNQIQVVPQFQISIPVIESGPYSLSLVGFNIWPTPFIIFCLVGLVTFHYSLSLLFFDVVYQLTMIIIHKQQNQSGVGTFSYYIKSHTHLLLFI